MGFSFQNAASSVQQAASQAVSTASSTASSAAASGQQAAQSAVDAATSTSNSVASEIAKVGSEAPSTGVFGQPTLDAAARGPDLSAMAGKARADLAAANAKYKDLYEKAARDGAVTQYERRSLEKCKRSLDAMDSSSAAMATSPSPKALAQFEQAKKVFWAAAAATAAVIFTVATGGAGPVVVQGVAGAADAAAGAGRDKAQEAKEAAKDAVDQADARGAISPEQSHDAMAQGVETMSGLSKKFHETSMDIIRNLRA